LDKGHQVLYLKGLCLKLALLQFDLQPSLLGHGRLQVALQLLLLAAASSQLLLGRACFCQASLQLPAVRLARGR
jgi:hypothetical protein